jgi:formate-dependent nitrite reductase membrane component NrfD
MAQSIKVTTTGAAGSATGSQTGTAYGVLAGIVVKFHASAPNTTDVTITETVNGVARNLLTLTNVNTSGYYNPQDAIHAVSGGAAIADMYMPFVLTGNTVTVSVAGSNALTNAVEVTLKTVQ